MTDLTDMQAYIDELNTANGGPFQLADANHFNHYYGITTREQLGHLLLEQTFSDVYKDMFGSRPRGQYTHAEMEQMLERWALEYVPSND